MIIHRIERTKKHLKLFSFDSISGRLNCEIIDEYQKYDNAKLISAIKKDELIKYSDKIVFNPVLEGAYSAPFKIYIDITDRCPLNCKHCLTKKLNMGNEISYDTLSNIAEECSELGVFFVKLGGGEPILHPNFEEILCLFSKNGQALSLSTNGYSITENVAQLLRKYNVKTTVSIEGTREIDEDIRGIDHFDVALKALGILQKYGVNVCLRVTLTKKTLDVNVFRQLVTLALQLNTKLKVSYCRPAGSSLDNNCLIDFSDQRKYFDLIKYLNSPELSNVILLDEGMMLEQPKALKYFMYDDRICGCTNKSMHINSSGFLSPCVFLGEDYLRKIPYQNGDIKKYWSGTLDKKVQMIRSIQTPNSCNTCKRICKYECLATRLFFNNNTNNPDPNCLKNYN